MRSIFWDRVNRQDWAICESVQRGMQSRVFQYGLLRTDGEREPRYSPVRRGEAGRAGSESHEADFEYIVLGLGGFGSAAAYWLARRAGAGVLGLEQFELGHVRGESQDHSRIIRLSYHTPGYVELAKHAFRAWAEVERDAGEQLVLKTGGLDFGPRVSAIPLSTLQRQHGRGRRDLRAPRRAGDHAPVAASSASDDEIHGLYQSESGIAMAARGNAAHVRMAREHGATLRDNVPVTAIRPGAGEIDGDGGWYHLSLPAGS